MAGITSEFSSNTPFDFPDGRVNEDLSRKMRIPQTITVPGGEEDHQSNGPKKIPGDGVPMSIPDRIELGSYSPKSDIPRDLKDEMVAVNSLSSMITPPRTLTVDDTKSAHYPQTSTAPVSGSPTAARGNRERRTNAVRDIDDESIAVGLEVIDEGTPLDSDSDVGHYMGGDSPDSRKFILQIQRLNSRVNELERNVEHNSVGFWSKMIFFAFTIINPVLLHWLFWKRR
ncbi:uncharacterized protein LOC111329467 [Stylophora pistillata]|nr:uncharacterized protein LOC111329467 [Stylophora pistillata]